MEIILDEGYMFGMGIFETMLISNSIPIMLKEHIERLNSGLKVLGIRKVISEEEVLNFVKSNALENIVLKIMVSASNTIFTTRLNPYTKENYEKGFSITKSNIKRNQTSPLTYLKSFNYSENILEKNKATNIGFDDALFTNYDDDICETCVSNIYLIKNSEIFTPSKESGLLSGTVRNYLIEKYDITEKKINFSEIEFFDEAFLTNSIMGIMPLKNIDSFYFKESKVASALFNIYLKEFQIQF